MGSDALLNASQKIVVVNTKDEVYPPQLKSFLMLQHMYERLIDKYDWFVRADEDVYLFHHNLKAFLETLDSSQSYYLGRQGFGRPHEKALLGLPSEGFCMGGTSVVLSKTSLMQIGPRLNRCLKSMVSVHEDTELGRCIYYASGLTCPGHPEVGFNFEFRLRKNSFTAKPKCVISKPKRISTTFRI